MLSTQAVLSAATVLTVCLLCGFSRIESFTIPCNVCNKASCPPINCSAGTVYDICECCQQCAQPVNSSCDRRVSAQLSQERFCGKGLICETNQTNSEGICKGKSESCTHTHLWNVDESTFCGCWGGRTICRAAHNHRQFATPVPPTPAIGVFGITAIPSKTHYVVGSTVNITCVYQGYPEPVLVFTHNHTIMNVTTHTRPRRYDTRRGTVLVATLTIKHLRERDSGKYTCLVMNSAGMAQTTYLVLTVRPNITVGPGVAPSFSNVHTSYSVVEGEKVVLECNAKGNSIPNISIKKGLHDITLSQRVVLTKRVEPQQWQQYLTLTLTTAFMTDAGQYSCIAENEKGTAIHSMFLHVKRPSVLCTFENDSCNWTLVEERSNIRWERQKASEVNDSDGPTRDVTRNDSDGHFLYLRASSSGGQFAVMNDNTRLHNVCKVGLWHRVQGDNSTRLKIIVRTHGSDKSKAVLADWDGRPTTNWAEASFPVESNARSWIQIVGKLGHGSHNYIAVDDVRYEKCPRSKRSKR